MESELVHIDDVIADMERERAETAALWQTVPEGIRTAIEVDEMLRVPDLMNGFVSREEFNARTLQYAMALIAVEYSFERLRERFRSPARALRRTRRPRNWNDWSTKP